MRQRNGRLESDSEGMAVETSGRPNRLRRDRLTPRERETVQLLAEGKSNREVAALLNITFKTVETHRANIFRKLHLHSFDELMRYAAHNGIVSGGR